MQRVSNTLISVFSFLILFNALRISLIDVIAIGFKNGLSTIDTYPSIACVSASKALENKITPLALNPRAGSKTTLSGRKSCEINIVFLVSYATLNLESR